MAGNHMKKIFKTIAIKEMQIKTSGIGKKKLRHYSTLTGMSVIKKTDNNKY